MDKITPKHSRSQRIPLIILAGIVVMIIIFVLSSKSSNISTPDSRQIPIATTATAAESPSNHPEDVDVTQEIKALLPDDISPLIKDAIVSEPGKIQVETSIVDPRGKNGSPQAEQAISICTTIVKKGYEYIAIMENDGTHYVVFGHPAYPAGQCSEI